MAARERPARRARRLAMVALFEAEFPSQRATTALRRLAAEWEAEPPVVVHARTIIDGVAHLAELDAEIATRAPRIPVSGSVGWNGRSSRSALFEVLYSAAFPSAGTIRDAVSLARTYAGESAARLVGGVLRGVARPEPEGDEG